MSKRFGTAALEQPTGYVGVFRLQKLYAKTSQCHFTRALPLLFLLFRLICVCVGFVYFTGFITDIHAVQPARN